MPAAFSLDFYSCFSSLPNPFSTLLPRACWNPTDPGGGKPRISSVKQTKGACAEEWKFWGLRVSFIERLQCHSLSISSAYSHLTVQEPFWVGIIVLLSIIIIIYYYEGRNCSQRITQLVGSRGTWSQAVLHRPHPPAHRCPQSFSASLQKALTRLTGVGWPTAPAVSKRLVS